MKTTLAICALLAVCPSASVAALSIFHDKTDFLAAVNVVALESFETTPNTGGYVVTVTTSLMHLEAGENTVLAVGDTPGGGAFATDGVKILGVDVMVQNGSPRLFTITFAQPITGFGFAVTDWGDQSGPGQFLVEVNGVEQVAKEQPPGLSNGSYFFYGFSDPENPFTQATLTSTTPTDGIGLDEFYLAPEPSRALLSLLGLGAVGLRRRRRPR